MNASPGAAVGKAVFDSATAVEWADRGEDVILVRRETNPDDLHGMIAAKGILTSRGGKTSHAAVVARGMGRTCVCGAEALDVDVREARFTVRDGTTVHEGDVISIDGTTGEVFLGEVPVAASHVVQYFEGEQVDDPRGHRGRPDHEARRRQAPAAGAHQRRHRRGRRPRPPLRRPGHRPVPHRAHVPRRAPPAGRGPDPGRRRAGQRKRARRAAAAAAAGLRRDPRGDGRAAGDDPADRPAAARVPARLHRAVRRDGAGGHPRAPQEAAAQAARRGPAAARAEPDARPARRPARPRDPGPVHDAGPGDPRGRRGPGQGGRRPAAGDHDPAGRRGPGARDRQAADRRRGPRGARRDRRRPVVHDRHDDRAAAGGADRRRDRRGRRVLLLRHQRPDPDDLGLLARRRGGGVLQRLPGAGHLRGVAVRVPRHRGRRVTRADRRGAGPGGTTRPEARRLRRARRRPRRRCTSSTRSGLDYVSCSPFRVPVARLEAGRSALDAD